MTARPSRSTPARFFAIATLLGFACFGSMSGCSDKKQGIEEAECKKLRQEAFRIIKEGKEGGGHGCAKDDDCAETKWPECRRAVSKPNHEAITGLEKKHTDGLCKNTSEECKDSPPVYCKQGLCAIKEPGEKRD